jgi:hypothetical protein
MKIAVDEMGFPLIEVKGLGSIDVWPVTKFQFERFIAATNKFGDKKYDMMLGLNPRVSYKHFDFNNYEKLFVSGINPQEALEYARWLGPTYDLLTVDEWRTFHHALGVHSIPDLPGDLSISATCIWNKLAGQVNTLKELTLVHDGLMEWVKKDSKFVGLGTPRPSFLHNVFNPLMDEWVPLKDRIFYLGFRLIRR